MPTNELVQNNFTKGLLTEYTGLNFPENAATDTDNCIYTLIGDVTRREGFNLEENFQVTDIERGNSAVVTYKWNNAGGDGLTQLVVQQTGPVLYFYLASSATISNPLSTQILSSPVAITSFVASGATFDQTIECTFADGNGYLFVYHPDCDPFYCSYSAGTITANPINIQIRDFNGIPEATGVTTRPLTLTAVHNYNLINQGWTAGGAWSATSTSTVSGNPSDTPGVFTVASGLSISGGDLVYIYCTSTSPTNNVPNGVPALVGTVSSYSGTTLTVTLTGGYGGTFTLFSYSSWTLTQQNLGHINTWFSDIGNYPGNSDVWWYFKDNTDVFDPTTTVANVTLSSTNAPQGHYILSAFNQDRTSISGIAGLTPVSTITRPRVGTWFQGRVWYAGVDAQQVATGNEPYYTWTESIYFSQVVETPADFGSCYQDNDPTSETLFDLLPTDGGVIQIQGSGSIYKLFPIANGMLVFAANGVWFITGSQGIGFSANDYTITKISAVQSISSTSYVDVQGLPYFWNEEGIYAVTPQQGGQLSVDPITVGTILTFYNNIPLSSKKLARGAYHPIDYIIQWIYKSDESTGVTDTYQFDRVLNFNTYNKAFYPYTVDTTQANINSILYVAGPGGSQSPDPVFKYLCSEAAPLQFNMSFAEENDDSYADWAAFGHPVNFSSYYITGYRLAGKSIVQWQPIYIQTYLRTNGAASAFYIQGLWDYSNSGDSGKWSSRQMCTCGLTRNDVIIRRHKIRGRGFALQLKVASVDGMPFDVIGWNSIEQVNTGY